MRRSSINRRCIADTDAGMTLFEMLVVLAILALSYALAMPSFRSTAERLDARIESQKLASHLKQARSLAINSNKPFALILDAKRKTYRIDGVVDTVQLPEHFGISLATARENARSVSDARVLFFADGSSSGGVVTLSDGPVVWSIGVEWLHGHVSTRPESPR